MTTRDHDERWDELALGHVLGGLPDTDASVFRGHLAGCGQCRARVAELRSMASDLAAAERDERATLRLRTQVDRRSEPATPRRPDVDAPVSLQRRSIVAAAVVAVVLLVLSLWTAYLRDQNGELRSVADAHARTLSVIGSGTSVPATTSNAVTGVVAVDGDVVAYSLAGLPVPDANERLVVWIERGAEFEDVATHTPEQLRQEHGRLAATVSAVDATRLLITIEGVVVPGQPVGRTVVEADLNVVRPDA